MGVRFPFVPPLAALLLWLGLAPAAIAQTPHKRDAIAASLERMMAGEVLHTNYGEGSRVQMALDAAFERGDTKLIRLAHRAWRPILASASKPVGTVAEPPHVRIESRTVLKLPRAATYAAEIFYSLNDGPFIHAGTLTASDDGVSTLATPWAPREPGFHHLRFQARITYGGAAADLPQEIRRLADVSYGIYDPDRGLRPDLAQFVMAPSRMSAQQLDPSLPDVPFVEWLRQLPRDAGAHAEQSLWTSVHCPRGPRIVDGPSNFGDICAVGYLPFGLAWIRTGRIQRYGDRARLVAQHPKVLAIQVLGREATEVYSLSDLSELFAMDPEQWPATNVSVVPQDIAVTRTGSGNLAMMDVTVTLRNYGGVDARDVLVTMMLSDGHEIYMFHLDVPRRGSTTFKWSEPMPWPYGAVVVTVDTIAGIGTAALRRDESTPERVKAFRFLNPSLAPPAYWDWLRSNGY